MSEILALQVFTALASFRGCVGGEKNSLKLTACACMTISGIFL